MVNCVHITGLWAILYLLFKMSAVSLNLPNNLIKYTEFNANINKWKLLVISAKLSIITNARNQQLQNTCISIISLYVHLYINYTIYNCELKEQRRPKLWNHYLVENVEMIYLVPLFRSNILV